MKIFVWNFSQTLPFKVAVNAIKEDAYVGRLGQRKCILYTGTGFGYSVRFII